MTALPKRDRQAERREATRREIVDAAWQIAREHGLGAVTLREVAARVGMQSPSLYTHFESKNAIYDTMFGEAWADYLRICEAFEAEIPKAPRKALLFMQQSFVDFAIEDHARFQLMNQRMMADFEPSAESYAPSVAVLALFKKRLAGLGIHAQADLDLCIAIVGGLIDSQFANDAGGDRWITQLPRAIDMFADEVGLPGPRLRRKR
ncbi:MAG: TetR/AcrR family transcriptional regulator [Pseudonocardiales bacterium]|nr:TetR/AcrR family transcriptional regulator [Pseudonocardiales bacterium]